MADVQGIVQEDPEAAAKLQQAFQETLIAKMAEDNRRTAIARTEATNIEVGTVPANSRVVATFGRTKVVNKGGQDVIVEETGVPIQAAKITEAIVKDKPKFDIDQEFAKMRQLTDPDEKEAFAQTLFVNLGSAGTIAQDKIRTIAAQRAGVNDAQAALDQNIALDNAYIAAGRLQPGANTTQTAGARAAFQAALSAANQLESDLIKKDPDIQKYNDYRSLLSLEFKNIERAQNRRDTQEATLPPLTDARLMNAKHAMGIETTDTKKLKEEVGKVLFKDKALLAIIDAGKQEFPRLLIHPDERIRRYAYNMIAGYERENLGLSKKDELPGYVKNLEKLVANREALLPDVDKKKLLKTTAIGEKAKGEERDTALYNHLIKQIEDTSRVKYQRIDMWAFPDSQFREVIDTVKANSKDGKVIMSDGVTAVMNAELTNPDKSVMTPQQKITGLVQALETSMKNDKGSAILPSVQNYLPVYAAEVRNDAMRAYVRQQVALPIPDFMVNTMVEAAEGGEAVGRATREAGEALIARGRKLLGIK